MRAVSNWHKGGRFGGSPKNQKKKKKKKNQKKKTPNPNPPFEYNLLVLLSKSPQNAANQITRATRDVMEAVVFLRKR